MSKVMLKLELKSPPDLSSVFYPTLSTESKAASDMPLEFTIEAGKLDMMAHTCNPSAWVVEAGGSRVQAS